MPASIHVFYNVSAEKLQREWRKWMRVKDGERLGTVLDTIDVVKNSGVGLKNLTAPGRENMSRRMCPSVVFFKTSCLPLIRRAREFRRARSSIVSAYDLATTVVRRKDKEKRKWDRYILLRAPQ